MADLDLPKAPLVSVPEGPGPNDGAAYWLSAADGAQLRAGLFRPRAPARGSVIISPGRTEPIEKYFEVIGELQARGFAVLCHDWRGQGHSARTACDPLTSHARGWRPFLSDFDGLLSAFADHLPKPWIALGHSMGGGLTALALAEGETRFDGVILSAPMLGVATGDWRLGAVERLSLLMNFLGRSKTLVTPFPDPLDEPFEGNILTHDRRRWERGQALIRAEPDLRLAGYTWGWLAFALVLSLRVTASRRIDRLSIPLTIVAAGDERLVSNSIARRTAERAPKGRYVEIAGALHEILMETDALRGAFWREFDALASALGLGGEAKPKAPSRGRPARPRGVLNGVDGPLAKT